MPKTKNPSDSLINSGPLVAPLEVLRETKKRSDELHEWLSAREHMFRELTEKIQVEAASVLAQFPSLVGERKLRTSADPFVIALARVEKLQVVTEEKPTASLKRRLHNPRNDTLHGTVTAYSDRKMGDWLSIGNLLPLEVAKTKPGSRYRRW